jgi:hypothetical protein
MQGVRWRRNANDLGAQVKPPSRVFSESNYLQLGIDYKKPKINVKLTQRYRIG